MKKVSKKYFELLDEIETRFHNEVDALETKLKNETGISDIEFFWCDGEIVGIGNEDHTMKLIHRIYGED